jgi:hypothetical protein
MFDVLLRPSSILHSPFSILVLLPLLLLSAGSVSAATRYVWQGSPSPGPPNTNWATAAYVIQDAADAAVTGDEIVVTKGIYAIGGRGLGRDAGSRRHTGHHDSRSLGRCPARACSPAANGCWPSGLTTGRGTTGSLPDWG